MLRDPCRALRAPCPAPSSHTALREPNSGADGRDPGVARRAATRLALGAGRGHRSIGGHGRSRRGPAPAPGPAAGAAARRERGRPATADRRARRSLGICRRHRRRRPDAARDGCQPGWAARRQDRPARARRRRPGCTRRRPGRPGRRPRSDRGAGHDPCRRRRHLGHRRPRQRAGPAVARPARAQRHSRRCPPGDPYRAAGSRRQRRPVGGDRRGDGRGRHGLPRRGLPVTRLRPRCRPDRRREPGPRRLARRGRHRLHRTGPPRRAGQWSSHPAAPSRARRPGRAGRRRCTPGLRARRGRRPRGDPGRRRGRRIVGRPGGRRGGAARPGGHRGRRRVGRTRAPRCSSPSRLGSGRACPIRHGWSRRRWRTLPSCTAPFPWPSPWPDAGWRASRRPRTRRSIGAIVATP